jgi:dTDP-4-amino-4,6-dideoxygalactose transaminase
VHGKGVFEQFSTNYRMTELQAAMAAAQLDRLEGIAETRAQLGRLLGEAVSTAPGVAPHNIAADDRSTFWFYMFRLQPNGLKCNRAEFVKALVAEGVPASAGYIPVPMYGNPVFQKHGIFAGRWPIKELGLTSMDYSNASCPEAEAILKSGVRLVVNEGMTEDFIRSCGAAIQKVAKYYAA